MARRKNQPESVRVKCTLSERLRDIRVELYGERGGSEMARRLGLPIRTWYNYEGGVTVPAEVLLRFVELTNVEPIWLLHGTGARYRTPVTPVGVEDDLDSVESLLRTALKRLERPAAEEPTAGMGASRTRDATHGSGSPHPSFETARLAGSGGVASASGGRRTAGGVSYRQWPDSFPEARTIQVEDDLMLPIVCKGAYVAYSEQQEEPEQLNGELVVAWLNGGHLVRWFEISGRYGLLRAENAAQDSSTVLIDLENLPAGFQLRRVLWISTPHR